MIEWERKETGEVLFLEEVPKDAKIISVHGIAVEAVCEVCGKSILEGEEYSCDIEGIELCEKCTSEMLNE